MGSSIYSAAHTRGGVRKCGMTDEDVDASLASIECLIHRCTSGFKLTPSAIREVISNVSTITRLSLDLTREMISRVKSLEESRIQARIHTSHSELDSVRRSRLGNSQGH